MDDLGVTTDHSLYAKLNFEEYRRWKQFRWKKPWNSALPWKNHMPEIIKLCVKVDFKL